MSKETSKERGDRLAAALSQTMDEKEALEVELANLKREMSTLIEWVMGDADALTVLQRLYLNGDEPAANRIKAAAAAIGYERPKPASTTLIVDFRERVRQARLAANAKLIEEAKTKAKVIEHQPDAPAPTPAAS